MQKAKKNEVELVTLEEKEMKLMPVLGTLNVDTNVLHLAPGFDKSIFQKLEKQARELLSKSEE